MPKKEFDPIKDRVPPYPVTEVNRGVDPDVLEDLGYVYAEDSVEEDPRSTSDETNSLRENDIAAVSEILRLNISRAVKPGDFLPIWGPVKGKENKNTRKPLYDIEIAPEKYTKSEQKLLYARKFAELLGGVKRMVESRRTDQKFIYLSELEFEVFKLDLKNDPSVTPDQARERIREIRQEQDRIIRSTRDVEGQEIAEEIEDLSRRLSKRLSNASGIYTHADKQGLLK